MPRTAGHGESHRVGSDESSHGHTRVQPSDRCAGSVVHRQGHRDRRRSSSGARQSVTPLALDTRRDGPAGRGAIAEFLDRRRERLARPARYCESTSVSGSAPSAFRAEASVESSNNSPRRNSQLDSIVRATSAAAVLSCVRSSVFPDRTAAAGHLRSDERQRDDGAADDHRHDVPTDRPRTRSRHLSLQPDF